MIYVFAGYVRSPGFSRPTDWIARIAAYLGVLEALARQNKVISIEQIGYTGEYLQDGVEYRFMNFGRKELFFPWRLHRAIRKCRPDIVLIHGISFPLQVIQLRMQLGGGTRIIVQNHTNGVIRGYRRILQPLADRCIDAYFFSSREMSEPWIRQGLIRNSKKIHEVMVGSSVLVPQDKEEARKKNNISGDPVFVWAGRLDENKDPETAIRAFLRFARERTHARMYLIYQSGELTPEWQALMEKQPGVIVPVGAVPHAEMASWLSAADFFVSSSHAEVFGAALAEAMSCGCIPVVTDIPSFRKITGAGCGWRYPPGDEEGLYRALLCAMDADLAEEKKKTLEQFSKHLSFHAIAESIQEISASL